MRLPMFFLPVPLAIFACGPGLPAETDTDPEPATTTTADATTDDTSTSPGTATTNPPTTSTATTSEPATTTEPAGTTDPGTNTATTGEPGTTDETATDGAPDVAFDAIFWAGGLDHLEVRMADLKDDRCISIQFARPGDVATPDLELPHDWWYQGALIAEGAADCLDFAAPLPAPVAAETIAGTATWDILPFCPPFIAIDVVLGFPQDQAWVPAEVTVAAPFIILERC